MKIGQTVIVYQKPLTKEQTEGKAKLLQRIPDKRDSEKVENWKVKFLSDEFICERLVSVQ
jgi:hypothetical protein